LSISPDGKYVVTGREKEGAVIRRASDLEPILILGTDGGRVTWSPNGKFIATGAGVSRGTVAVWDLETKQVMQTVAHERLGGVKSVAFNNDSSILASCAWDGCIKLWRVQDLSLLRVINNIGRVQQIVFHPTRPLLLSAGLNLYPNKDLSFPAVCMWDVNTGNLVRKFDGVIKFANAVAFSLDGRVVAAGDSASSNIEIWNTDDGSHLRTLTGHEGAIWSLAFLNENNNLVSGGIDGSVKLWDVHRKTEVLTLTDFVDLTGAPRGRKGVDGFARVSFSKGGNAVFSTNGSAVMVFRSSDSKTKQVEPLPSQVPLWTAKQASILPSPSPLSSSH